MSATSSCASEVEPSIHVLLSADVRDVAWLKKCLQLALRIEFLTIPPYLYAYWCVKDPASELADALLGISWQEMVHMGLVCNMLTALGEKPDIVGAAPVFPRTGLPGGVHTDLTVSLKGVSARNRDEACPLAVFMKIEEPRHPLARSSGSTVGEFYAELAAGMRAVYPKNVEFTAFGEQVVGRIGGDELTAVTTRDQALKAIELISEQGEGTRKQPTGSTDPADLAHYYRFAQLWWGARMRRLPQPVDGAEWDFGGETIERAGVHPFGEVPAGGWGSTVPPAVRDALDACNVVYTHMVHQLQQAWTPPADEEEERSPCSV